MRHTTLLPVIIILAACAPVQAVPTLTSIPPTDAPTPTVTLAPSATSTAEPTATPTIEPTATATKQPTATLVALPADLAVQVDKLSEAQKASLLGKPEDTAWKLAVYDRIREGSPNLKLTLGLWENPATRDDVEVVYKLPSDPSVIYLPGTKLWADHSLPPAEITQDMMKNQEVVGKYIPVVSKEMEKTSYIPAGSKLARVNGDLVYLSEEGVEAKLNVKTGIFEQQVVRNAEGQIPLKDGVSVKLLEIKEYTGGPYDFTEKSGINPLPGAKWKSIEGQLPIDCEVTVFVFDGYNVSSNDMNSFGRSKNIPLVIEDPSDENVAVTTYLSDPGSDYARLIIGVKHKVGNKVLQLSVTKEMDKDYRVVFRADDPVTKGLIPQ